MQSIIVADYLTRRPVTFSADMLIEAAVEKLLHSGQSGGPVVDNNKQVVGFLSEQDCLKKMLEATYSNESHFTVSDVMNTKPICVQGSESILKMADRMIYNPPKLYPVVDEDGFLMGVITRANVLVALDKHLQEAYSGNT